MNRRGLVPYIVVLSILAGCETTGPDRDEVMRPAATVSVAPAPEAPAYETDLEQAAPVSDRAPRRNPPLPALPERPTESGAASIVEPFFVLTLAEATVDADVAISASLPPPQVPPLAAESVGTVSGLHAPGERAASPRDESVAVSVALPTPEPVLLDDSADSPRDAEPLDGEPSATSATVEESSPAESEPANEALVEAPVAVATATATATGRTRGSEQTPTGSASSVRDLDKTEAKTETSAPASPPVSMAFSFAIRLSRTGIIVPVALDGFGWIYLPDSSEDGYVYVGRELTESGSTFNFRVDRPRDYTLSFQRQDNKTGSFEFAVVELLAAEAMSENEIAGSASLQRSTVPTAPGGDQPGEPAATKAAPPAAAAELAAAGRFLDALKLYERLIADGRAEFSVRAGDVAAAAELFDVAAEHYAAGLTLSAADSTYRVALKLLDSAERSGGALGSLTDALPALLGPGVLRYREDLQRLANLFRDLEGRSEEAAVLDALLARYPSSAGNDLVLFRLGRIYETEGAPRDERRAFEYYRRLTLDYPLSEYYEQAEERMRHIERYYLNIR